MLGWHYKEGWGVKKNTEEGFQWLLQSAQAGFVSAIEDVSNCYKDGIGVEKNPEEAERWANRYKELFDEEIDNSHDHPEESRESRDIVRS